MAEPKSERRRARRSGGRDGNARRSAMKAVSQSPWFQPTNRDRPTDPLSDDAIEAIHNGALRILSELGIEFLNEEARDILKDAGCEVAAKMYGWRPNWSWNSWPKRPRSLISHRATPSERSTWVETRWRS